MSTKINLIDLEKRVLGRHDYTEDGALILAWSVTGFEMRFEAERVNIHFKPDYIREQPTYLKLFLDERLHSKFAVSTGREVAVIEDIPEGVHTLKLIRVSMCGSNKHLSVAAVELIGREEKVLTPPCAPELRMEFFGDSITCGYGDLGSPDNRAYFTHEEDATKTYAYLTAEALGADIRVEAVSGQGIVRNCNGDVDYPIPVFFSHKLFKGCKPHDFSEWTPHVVVVNAGTNDGGGRVSKEDFGEGASKFIDHIREVYPEAEIFWVYGLMSLMYEKTLESVIAAKDERTHFIPIRPIYEIAGDVGANGHPGLNGQKRAAKILTEAVKNVLEL